MDASVPFLRQRLSSDYCAVYSGAMLLSLAGQTTNRSEAHRLFGTTRSGWVPPDDIAVADALARAAELGHIVLRRGRFGSLGELSATLRHALSCSTGVLMAARCNLVPEQVTALHAVVVTAVSDKGIYVIDPLGRPPCPGTTYNACIQLGSTGRTAHVQHARWRLGWRNCISLISIRRNHATG